MRHVILDTETSGLDFENDRIIEVGCLELVDGIFTGEKFHKYYKPDNIIISIEAEEIHGLNNDILSKFPTFDEKIEDFLDFIDGSELIIHNAQFDLTMINSSLKRLSKPEIKRQRAICTLELAKKKFPGSKNNLNALCRRFNINLDIRDKHGALIDSFLLLEVYKELIGGKQQNLKLSINQDSLKRISKKIDTNNLAKVTLNDYEIDAHKKMLEKLNKNIWNS